MPHHRQAVVPGGITRRKQTGDALELGHERRLLIRRQQVVTPIVNARRPIMHRCRQCPGGVGLVRAGLQFREGALNGPPALRPVALHEIDEGVAHRTGLALEIGGAAALHNLPRAGKLRQGQLGPDGRQIARAYVHPRVTDRHGGDPRGANGVGQCILPDRKAGRQCKEQKGAQHAKPRDECGRSPGALMSKPESCFHHT
jgi:hypothetical protein